MLAARGPPAHPFFTFFIFPTLQVVNTYMQQSADEKEGNARGRTIIGSTANHSI
ncbi:hypothetical protein KSC_082690 [Ktedonobacter sp. SOSP1-52]|nr:hypothetical protein KSC_082690 [Ktedonobacter sp. SOSP1-52]